MLLFANLRTAPPEGSEIIERRFAARWLHSHVRRFKQQARKRRYSRVSGLRMAATEQGGSSDQQNNG
jgi:hypothetical protein